MTGTVRKALDARIMNDHYDLGAILERLLFSAALGDFTAAKSDAKVFERLGFAAGALSILSKVAHGDVPVVAAGQVYVVDAPKSVDIETLGATLNTARIELAKIVNKPPKVAWVDFHDGPCYANVTRFELPGVARTSLSREFQVQSDWPAILWHEAAHATMFAGVRFLDEGWAVWCQAKSGVKSAFPVPDAVLGTYSLAAQIEAMPLPRLLAYSGRDLIFSDLATSEHEWRSIYVRAYRFFGAIHAKLGMDGVVTMFEALAKERQDIAGTLRRNCNASLEEIEGLRRQATVLASGQSDLRVMDLPLRTSLAEPHIGGRSEDLNVDLEKVRSHTAEDERTLRRRGQELLAEIAIQGARQMRKPPETVVAELDSIIATLVDHGWVAGAELLKAKKLCVALLVSTNWIEKATYSNAAQSHFQHAESASPNDAEISLSFAKFELNKPASFRNIDHAVERLNRAARDTSWCVEAEAVARTYGLLERLAKADEPGAPITSAATSDGPPSIRVTDLRLETKKRFTLDIKQLEVPQGSRVAIVGANGAGKTTLLDAIVGLRTADVADILVFGGSIVEWRDRPELRTQCGYQSQRPSFPPHIRVWEIMRLREACYGKARASADTLEVRGLSKLEYGALSTGQRRRVDLYVALGHEPPLALLDEPTSGLDSYFQEVVRKLILNSGVRTILFASNERRELECATHVLWLNAGKVAKFGTAESVLLETVGRYRAEVLLRDKVSAARWLDVVLGKQTTLRRHEITNDGAVRLFADSALDPHLQDCLGEVESYTFAKTGYADLVRAISHGASRV